MTAYLLDLATARRVLAPQTLLTLCAQGQAHGRHGLHLQTPRQNRLHICLRASIPRTHNDFCNQKKTREVRSIACFGAKTCQCCAATRTAAAPMRRRWGSPVLLRGVLALAVVAARLPMRLRGRVVVAQCCWVGALLTSLALNVRHLYTKVIDNKRAVLKGGTTRTSITECLRRVSMQTIRNSSLSIRHRHLAQAVPYLSPQPMSRPWACQYPDVPRLPCWRWRPGR